VRVAAPGNAGFSPRRSWPPARATVDHVADHTDERIDIERLYHTVHARRREPRQRDPGCR
jgi:hypothetical protein